MRWDGGRKRIARCVAPSISKPLLRRTAQLPASKPRSRRPAFHHPTTHSHSLLLLLLLLPLALAPAFALAFPHRPSGTCRRLGDTGGSGPWGAMDGATEPPWMDSRRVPVRRYPRGARTIQASRSTSKANQAKKDKEPKPKRPPGRNNNPPAFQPDRCSTLSRRKPTGGRQRDGPIKRPLRIGEEPLSRGRADRPGDRQGSRRPWRLRGTRQVAASPAGRAPSQMPNPCRIPGAGLAHQLHCERRPSSGPYP